MTLGSLFDGSGGFPLAGALSGIRPVWEAEVEPYPIAVTRSRFPMMQHLGSVTEVHGDKVQPVDVITFGSPCQDLSVAGKRAGIHDGQRSNLFFEAIRIIKEMRAATNGRYPTFAVWENVPGAFSSNQGEDFRCVLQEFVEICGNGTVPRPDKGKWKSAGEVVGDGYSVAWRQLDAQYWGVPQRRKRIYLVADFRGERAGEILFEREGLRRHPAPGGATGQGAAADAPRGAGGSRGIECLNPWDCQSKRIYQPDGVCPTLPAMDCGGANNQAVLYALDSMSSNSMKSTNPHSGFHAETIAKTLQAGGVDPTCNQGGNSVPGVCYPQVARTLTAEADASPCIDRGQNVVCYDARGNGDGTRCPTLTGDHENRVTDYTAVTVYRSPKIGEYAADGTASTMAARDFKSPRDLVVERSPAYGVDCRNAALDEEKTHTLQAKANGGQSLNCTPSVLTSGRPPRKYIIRRLTPLECCRLQGFPDGWGVPAHKDKLSDEELAFWQRVRDTCAAIGGKPSKKYSAEALTKWYNGLHTDSAEYKMWGNGIALPCAAFVLEGIAEALERTYLLAIELAKAQIATEEENDG